MKDYKILSSHSTYNLQNVVNHELENGYVLCGGPFVDISHKTSNSDFNDYYVTEVRTTIKKYCQAVYKNSSPETFNVG